MSGVAGVGLGRSAGIGGSHLSLGHAVGAADGDRVHTPHERERQRHSGMVGTVALPSGIVSNGRHGELPHSQLVFCFLCEATLSTTVRHPLLRSDVL